MPCCFLILLAYVLMLMILGMRLYFTIAYRSTQFEEWAWLIKKDRPEMEEKQKEIEQGKYD